MSTPDINIVIPLYNEEEVFDQLIQRLTNLIEGFPKSIEVILVDDGSSDKTAELMTDLALNDERFQALILSRNFGHQLALSSGLAEVNATEGVMVIDGDLQDPPELLSNFYSKFKEGYDLIYGVRTIRRDEGLFKKKTSYYFYRILRKLTNVNIPTDSGDFCFMSTRIVKVLSGMPEERRFIRGMRAWIGFNQASINYDREERVAGSTKYSISKMLRLAFDAIYGFSDLPIKAMTRLGLVTILFSFGYLIFSLVKKFVLGAGVASGFSGLLFTMILLSGVQLLSLGIIGEYIVRTFFQVKQRPLFIVKEKVKNKTREQ